MSGRIPPSQWYHFRMERGESEYSALKRIAQIVNEEFGTKLWPGWDVDREHYGLMGEAQLTSQKVRDITMFIRGIDLVLGH